MTEKEQCYAKITATDRNGKLEAYRYCTFPDGKCILEQLCRLYAYASVEKGDHCVEGLPNQIPSEGPSPN